MNHDLEFKSMFLMTDEMRLAATSVATARFSIPLCLRFFPQKIYFSYFLTEMTQNCPPDISYLNISHISNVV